MVICPQSVYLDDAAACYGISEKLAIATRDIAFLDRAKKAVTNNEIRGMKLLTREICENIPDLSSPDNKGGKAVIYVKFFTPDSNWTWYVLQGEPVLDSFGSEIDFKFFGLVDGFEKELGYFCLSELEAVRGPMGLPIERDLYWAPRTLEQIAPGLFKN